MVPVLSVVEGGGAPYRICLLLILKVKASKVVNILYSAMCLLEGLESDLCSGNISRVTI